MKTKSGISDGLTNSSIANPKNTPLKSLLTKEVSRSQFLKISAMGLLSVLGFSNIIHFLTGKQTNVTKIVTTPAENSPTVYGHKIKVGKK